METDQQPSTSLSISSVERCQLVDQLLQVHLLRCLKYWVRDRDLPVLVSTLWGAVKK